MHYIFELFSSEIFEIFEKYRFVILKIAVLKNWCFFIKTLFRPLLKVQSCKSVEQAPSDVYVQSCSVLIGKKLHKTVHHKTVCYKMVQETRVCHSVRHETVRQITVQHHKTVRASQWYVTKRYSYINVNITKRYVTENSNSKP
jgi:hypothetical protein